MLVPIMAEKCTDTDFLHYRKHQGAQDRDDTDIVHDHADKDQKDVDHQKNKDWILEGIK